MVLLLILFVTAVAVLAAVAHEVRSRSKRRKAEEAVVSDAKERPVLCSKRVFVLVNSRAGGGLGAAVYEEVIHRVLTAAGVSVDAVQTQSTAHVKNVASVFNPSSYSCVLFVSGDGTIHEFLNAYISAQRGLSSLQDFQDVPICPVPVGTCNVLALSLGYRTPLEAVSRVLLVLRGQVSIRNCDLYSVIRAAKPEEFRVDFGLVCWGAIADIDLEWERLPRNLSSVVREILKILVVLKHILYLRSRRTSVLLHPCDGGPPRDLSGEYVLASMQNVGWIDSDSLFIPKAQPDDGKLHILLWKAPTSGWLLSRLEMLVSFLYLDTQGSHTSRHGITIDTACRLEFAPEDGEMDMCGTGESELPQPKGGKVILDVLPGALRVV